MVLAGRIHDCGSVCDPSGNIFGPPHGAIFGNGDAVCASRLLRGNKGWRIEKLEFLGGCVEHAHLRFLQLDVPRRNRGTVLQTVTKE
jgi:hypothetical protein